MIFQKNDIVTLKISKKDHTATNYYWVVIMTISILHEDQYQIQTKFGILNYLYSINKLKTIPFMDQKYYKIELLAAFSKSIFYTCYGTKNCNY